MHTQRSFLGRLIGDPLTPVPSPQGGRAVFKLFSRRNLIHPPGAAARCTSHLGGEGLNSGKLRFFDLDFLNRSPMIVSSKFARLP